MDITYLGHSCFKLRTTNATVVTDPFDKSIGFELPRVTADIVTVSHQHPDHNNIKAINPSSRRDRVFVIDAVGEYEVGGVSVFGVHSFHDDQNGALRGKNNIYSIVIDDVSIVHLGDLGHLLKQSQINELGKVDVLLCPVGGHYTIDPKRITELVNQLEPAVLIPMHFKTDQHDPKTFGELIRLEDFLKEFGGEVQKTDKLSLTAASIPEDMQLVVLESS